MGMATATPWFVPLGPGIICDERLRGSGLARGGSKRKEKENDVKKRANRAINDDRPSICLFIRLFLWSFQSFLAKGSSKTAKTFLQKKHGKHFLQKNPETNPNKKITEGSIGKKIICFGGRALPCSQLTTELVLDLLYL
jgi:hypothetical protein